LKALLGLWGTGGTGGVRPVVEGNGVGEAVVRRDGTVYPAVVLWSNEPRNVMPLVAPRPLAASAFGKGRSDPLIIPFDGQYLVLRSADQTPGPGALVRYGSPAKQRFFSNDFHPLYMEARQNLGAHFDRQCCREIRVEITDADTDSRMVDLELILSDSQLHRRGSQTLGTQHVRTEGILSPPATDRTLSFVLPRDGLSKFDEVRVRYWLNRWHRFESAKIAIRRFVLVPR
jgi:hypothetical protein